VERKEDGMSIGTLIEHLEQVVSEVLANEWEAQGHHMNGAVVRDIEYVAKYETNKILLSGLMYPYGMIIAAGTPENKIPFSGRTGRGGTSLYIAALQNYAKARMGVTDEKKSLSIAFAIATKQKAMGMPTPGSYRFSSTGKRKDWIELAFKNNEDKITEAIRQMGVNVVSANIDVMLAKWNVLLNQ
jgi:hypothetical protein